MLLSVFCVFLGLAALGSILENRGSAETNLTDDMLYADEEGAPEEISLAAEPEGEFAAEIGPGEDAAIFQEFDRIGELVEKGELEQAREVFRNVSKRFPRVWEIFMTRRVQPLIEQGNIEQALYLLESGLEVNSEAPPEAFEYAGLLHWELGHPVEALHAFERTALNHPWYVPAYRDIVLVANDQEGQLISDSISILENLKTTNQQEGALHHSLGNLYFYNGRDDQAIAALQTARDRYFRTLEDNKPDQMMGWNSLGLATVLFYLDEDLDAIPGLLREAEEFGRREKDQRLLEELGWLYVEMEDCANVTRLFGEIKDQFPSYQPPVELREECP